MINPRRLQQQEQPLTPVPKGTHEAWVALRVYPPDKTGAVPTGVISALKSLSTAEPFELYFSPAGGNEVLLRVMVKGADEVPALLRGIVRRVASKSPLAVWIASGMPREAREGITNSSREARECMEIARRVWSTPHAVSYADVVPFLALASDRTKCGTLARVLEPLEQHDRRNRARLVKTLEELVEQGWSVAATARRLEVHRHTVEYRLRKVEGLLSLDLKESRDRFVAEAAVAARKILVADV